MMMNSIKKEEPSVVRTQGPYECLACSGSFTERCLGPLVQGGALGERPGARVAVLVSGGVDSSVALRLLKDQGHNLTAFYLKIWLEDELSHLGDCPWEEDLSYVRAVCDRVGVPLQVVNLQEEYLQDVVGYMVAEIKKGRTPNPDMLCNKRIKFGTFYTKYASQFDYVATGHYAQVIKDEKTGHVRLCETADVVKDQTYFLSHLSQEQLQKALFPIGHLTKEQVRALAVQYQLPNATRKDSQGICFLGKIRVKDFIKHHVGEMSGDLVEEETGVVVGTHPGFFYYTSGQRQGIGLAGGPWYVVRKDPTRNIVFISRQYYDADKSRKIFEVTDCNWIGVQAPSLERCTVKLRHGPAKHDCAVTLIAHGALRVELVNDDQGIAPGQFAAFYCDGVCLGSGIISTTLH